MTTAAAGCRSPRPNEEPASAYFLSANRGKRSVRLDLKQPDGVERLRALSAEADVLVRTTGPA